MNEAADTSAMNLQSWFKQEPQRKNRALRHTSPAIVAYYFDGGAPNRNTVKDISQTGAYVCTEARWCVGTIIWIAFQKEAGDDNGTSSVPSITLPCKVVWEGPDGFGVHFVMTDRKQRKTLEQFIHGAVTKDSQQRPQAANSKEKS